MTSSQRNVSTTTAYNTKRLADKPSEANQASQASQLAAADNPDKKILKVEEISEVPKHIAHLLPDYDPQNAPIVMKITVPRSKKTKRREKKEKEEEEEDEEDLSDRFLVPDLPSAHTVRQLKPKLPAEACVPQETIVEGPAGVAVFIRIRNNPKKSGKRTAEAPDKPVKGILFLADDNKPVFVPDFAVNKIINNDGKRGMPADHVKGTLIKGPTGLAVFQPDHGPKIGVDGKVTENVKSEDKIVASQMGDTVPVSGVLVMNNDGQPEFVRIKPNEPVEESKMLAAGVIVRDKKTGYDQFIQTGYKDLMEGKNVAKEGEVTGVIVEKNNQFVYMTIEDARKENAVPVGHVIKANNGAPVYAPTAVSGQKDANMDHAQARKALDKEMANAMSAENVLAKNAKTTLASVRPRVTFGEASTGRSPTPAAANSSVRTAPVVSPSPAMVMVPPAERPGGPAGPVDVRSSWTRDAEYKRFLYDRSVMITPGAMNSPWMGGVPSKGSGVPQGSAAKAPAQANQYQYPKSGGQKSTYL